MEQVATENNWISALMRSQCRTHLGAAPPAGYGSCSICTSTLLHVDSSAKEECSQLSHSCCSGMVTAGRIHPGHRQQGYEILLPWPRGKGCHLLTPSFVALQEKTWEILGSYKKGRWASTWDGHFPRYRICRDLIIGVEDVVTVCGISWHGLPGVGDCLWIVWGLPVVQKARFLSSGPNSRLGKHCVIVLFLVTLGERGWGF